MIDCFPTCGMAQECMLDTGICVSLPCFSYAREYSCQAADPSKFCYKGACKLRLGANETCHVMTNDADNPCLEGMICSEIGGKPGYCMVDEHYTPNKDDPVLEHGDPLNPNSTSTVHHRHKKFRHPAPRVPDYVPYLIGTIATLLVIVPVSMLIIRALRRRFDPLYPSIRNELTLSGVPTWPSMVDSNSIHALIVPHDSKPPLDHLLDQNQPDSPAPLLHPPDNSPFFATQHSVSSALDHSDRPHRSLDLTDLPNVGPRHVP